MMDWRAYVAPILANGAYVVELAGFALIVPHLGVTAEQGGWLFAAYSFALSATLIVGGRLGDRMGAVRVFRLGLALFILASVGMALVSAATSLLAFRILQGIGAGLFSPLVPVLITAQDGHSGQQLSTWGVISSLFSASAPGIVSLLLITQSWQVAWSVVPILAILGFVLFAGRAPDEKPARSKVDWANVVALLPMLFYVFVCFGANTYFIFAMPQAAADARLAGLVSTVMWVASFLAGLVVVRLIARISPYWFLSLGPVVNFGAVVLLLNGNFYAAALTAGAGLAIINGPTTAKIFDIAHPSQRGLAASLDIICARIGGGMAVVLFS